MLRRLMHGLIDILYPEICIACRDRLAERAAIDGLVCAECWGKARINLPPFCHSCGRHLEKAHLYRGICPGCIRRRLHFDRAFSPFVYEGVIKELLHEFKYKNKPYLGSILSQPMIEFIKEYDLPMQHLDFIIPVPLHKTRLREREFNQAQILSSHIAQEFNKELLSDCLMRHRQTKTQTELEQEARLLNVKDSFNVAEDARIKGRNILLVDDVLTTAATCSEAACALKRAGAGMVFVLTLAN